MRTIKELEDLRQELLDSDCDVDGAYDLIREEINSWYYRNRTAIDYVGNTPGELSVSYNDGRYYWSVDGEYGEAPEEITKELYDALLNFKKSKDETK